MIYLLFNQIFMFMENIQKNPYSSQALGLVALAISVYQFGDCVNDVAHVI